VNSGASGGHPHLFGSVKEKRKRRDVQLSKKKRGRGGWGGER